MSTHGTRGSTIPNEFRESLGRSVGFEIGADNGLFFESMAFPLTALASRDLSEYPIFLDGPFASWILTGTHQQPRLHHFCRHGDLIIDLDAQAFSRRLPWHPQGVLVLPPDGRALQYRPFFWVREVAVRYRFWASLIIQDINPGLAEMAKRREIPRTRPGRNRRRFSDSRSG